jgi:hypothetical protein
LVVPMSTATTTSDLRAFVSIMNVQFGLFTKMGM